MKPPKFWTELAQVHDEGNALFTDYCETMSSLYTLISTSLLRLGEYTNMSQKSKMHDEPYPEVKALVRPFSGIDLARIKAGRRFELLIWLVTRFRFLRHTFWRQQRNRERGRGEDTTATKWKDEDGQEGEWRCGGYEHCYEQENRGEA